MTAPRRPVGGNWPPLRFPRRRPFLASRAAGHWVSQTGILERGMIGGLLPSDATVYNSRRAADLAFGAGVRVRLGTMSLSAEYERVRDSWGDPPICCRSPLAGGGVELSAALRVGSSGKSFSSSRSAARTASGLRSVSGEGRRGCGARRRWAWWVSLSVAVTRSLTRHLAYILGTSDHSSG
jgi:hypothetical protein